MKNLYNNIKATINNNIDFDLTRNLKVYIYLTTFTTIVIAVALHLGLS